MYVNENLLRSKMSEKGFNISSLADITGINRDTISNVLYSKTAPSYPVINILYFTLEMTPEEGIAIFFNNDLRKTKFKKKSVS